MQQARRKESAMAPKWLPRLSSIALLTTVLALAATGVTPALASGSCLVKNRTSGVVFTRTTGDSLQSAIDAAFEGEVLAVRGRCVGSYVIERALTIVGVETARYPTATIDANGGPTVITINAGAAVSLRRLIVTGGEGTSLAGGIANTSGGDLVLAHTWVTGNRSDGRGGGIYYVGDSLRLRSSRVSENRSRFSGGGGIYLEYGHVVLLGTSRVDHNSGNIGGGIFNGGTLDMYDSSIVNRNVSVNSGGGIFGGLVVLHDTARISGNHAGKKSGHTSAGGGVAFATLVLEDASVIAWNRSYSQGGGVCVDTSSVEITDDARIVHNHAPDGGGICSYGGSVTMSGRSTVASNTAKRNGGGIWFLEGALTMSEDATITLNTARGGDPTAPNGIGGGVRTCDTVLTGVTEGVNVLANVPNDIENCR